MTYTVFSALGFGQRPVYLYEFTRGATITRFTSNNTDYTYASQTWTASSISHDKIRQSSDADRIELRVTFPLSDAYADDFLAPVSAQETTLKIRRGHANDTDQEFLVRYTGRVVGTKADLRTITLIVEDEFSTTRRKGIIPVMQRPCRHAHYGPGCGLNITTFNVSGTATAVSGLEVTVTEAGSSPDGTYDAGVITYGLLKEMVTKHTGTTLRLVSPLPGLADEITGSGSASVSIAPGCNLTMAVCDDSYSNLNNHGGFPWMSDNPFDGRSIY